MKIFETTKKYGEKAYLTPTDKKDEYMCLYADKKCKKCKAGKKCKINKSCLRESNFNSLKEALSHDKTLNQLKDISKLMKSSDISRRSPDKGFANALKTSKRDVTDSHILTYAEYLKQPFKVNQNRKPL